MGATGRLTTDPRSIEAALARTGWDAGAQALVAGWVEHRQDELEWEETWEPDDRCRYISACPTGERFVVEWVTGDTWELSIAWPDGWGREHLRMGFLEDLQDTAAEIRDAEGPFGGPQARACTECSCQALPACALPDQRGQRLAGDVELRFELLRDDLAAYFFITRDGRLNNLWIVHFDPADLPAALESLERMPRFEPRLWAWTQGKRRAWSFTGWRPLLGRMRLERRELLLACADDSTAIILAHEAGRLQAAVQLGISELADFDAGSWLATAPSWQSSRRDPAAAGASRDNSPAHAGATVREAPRSNVEPPAKTTEPAQSGGDVVARAVPPPAKNSSAPPVHAGIATPTSPGSSAPAHAASTTKTESPGGDGVAAAARESALPLNGPEPGPPANQSGKSAPPGDSPLSEAQSPQEPASDPPKLAAPRFPLAAGASADDLQRHFSEVEAAIPPRKIGAATAVELWLAIREAHNLGVLPITGNWVDLVASLHRRGLLAHLPSDRATRSALLILAELSPLVRRLHHRRWVLGIER